MLFRSESRKPENDHHVEQIKDPHFRQPRFCYPGIEDILIGNNKYISVTDAIRVRITKTRKNDTHEA